MLVVQRCTVGYSRLIVLLPSLTFLLLPHILPTLLRSHIQIRVRTHTHARTHAGGRAHCIQTVNLPAMMMQLWAASASASASSPSLLAIAATRSHASVARTASHLTRRAAAAAAVQKRTLLNVGLRKPGETGEPEQVQ